MKLVRNILVGFALVLIGVNCDHGTEPFNPRKLSFSMYTFSNPQIPQFFLNDIWGTSSKSVYAVGETSGRYGQMWHFDGSNWSEVNFERPIYSGTSYQLTSVTGFSENNIWAVGTLDYLIGSPVQYYDSSAILHFDGVQWKDTDVRIDGTLLKIWGMSPTDIWAGGTKASMLHFDGASWTATPLPVPAWISDIKGSASLGVYATAYYEQNAYFLFHWTGNAWVIADSSREGAYSTEKFGYYGLLAQGDHLYSVGLGGCYVKTATGWSLLQAASGGAFTELLGLSGSEFYVGGTGGLFFHYNGSDFLNLGSFPTTFAVTGFFAADNEVFVSGTELGGTKSFVYIGK